MSTPTKAAEIIREALEAASKELDCSDWGEVDVNGEGALKPYSHDIVAMPQGCPACKVRHALSLLADLDGGGEVVAWMHEKTKDTQSDEWVRYWRLEGLKYPNGANADGYNIPLYTHPSPTAADAPPEADRSKPQPSVDEFMEVMNEWSHAWIDQYIEHRMETDLRDRFTKKFNK